ncbi:MULTISPECIES: FKBP-type peptidyl-prolyl cis-trans isomerase [Chryseobacterium]|uniref:Peptidyl-prolyl cis-trans isomerase n=1 Tax=Chryseobacterium camelliae TaxID=1265445 RepID=A0ABU0TD67_9FLAO|nr:MULTISPECIES: FKBP-type peptidyl-prolyl cis-trans isomerase [Chryseobacterium]MDT3407200.1 FKBP-type peptidyl-prolyl cis-trans isomerase FklB [Pseudacidovorax intermedius]MDQ1095009.1 FKBP-type peptidyl-prolyl cis-trans isomerase FklB [Chryseobacterium camelliae]MDQ1098949.1 FKBP-type peptidyl-prolyl cis-trans isomerase FklB [Chryseobacterium sp. SORGH_AS_1048]MDR6086297.1 FKBP-type peptidyl-prolyl cis-trans isomerase FklB [Chryseobacterium sp. SORGH_AS_0909]MDR6130669.1 FKBP-type peptidyl-
MQKTTAMGVSDILQKRKKELAEKNLRDGNEYREEYGKRESVITLPSGLQYEIITEGNGAKPGPKSTVKCHYHGTTISGKIFDSSVKRGQPASFPLNRVIEGWTEALQLMPVGSKWRLIIPPHLAYGDQQISKEIGPNSTLVFEVELLDIK